MVTTTSRSLGNTSVGEVKSWDSDITTVLNVLNNPQSDIDNKREREQKHLARGSKLVNKSKSNGASNGTRKSTMKSTRGSLALAKKKAAVEMIDYPKNKEGTSTIEFKTK